ncbi:cytochrome c oxidase assembly protein [Luteimonas deserti]|uniref:Cytochrome c oxidase assembly protein n=1 Tax=Luteimonas deserti TaxID=2752306 RepID=A0A7Z0QP81_9GAMM|nr:cytochrome c oxidase assembly protein [Luteimonas deserti]NYZ61215.1 cytochrome c oxidase assembly protein [Luteimonas deserti]
MPAWAALPEGPPPTPATAWTPATWSLAPLALALLAYAGGWRRQACARRRDAVAFAGGAVAIALALVWPLEAFGAYSLGAHVAQHLLLLAVAPALLVAGRPGATMRRALPRGARLRRLSIAGRSRPVLLALAPATAAHIAAMLVWHLPAATSASLVSVPVHRVMVASVLLAGLWFWTALWHRLRARDAGAGGGLVALVTVMMAMGFLGALLTFSPRVLYPAYSDRALLLGLDPLFDQQLAGLLMWVPAATPYLAAGLVLVIALLRRKATTVPPRATR